MLDTRFFLAEPHFGNPEVQQDVPAVQVLPIGGHVRVGDALFHFFQLTPEIAHHPVTQVGMFASRPGRYFPQRLEHTAVSRRNLPILQLKVPFVLCSRFGMVMVGLLGV